MFAVRYDHPLAPAHASFARAPVPLYEALCLVLLALLLTRIDRRRPGLRVMVYAALYASARLALEALRADAVRGTFGLLSTGQIVSAVVLAGCAAWLFLRARAPRMQRTAA
jgi:prolipoprotein diacylglyceryltransferase